MIIYDAITVDIFGTANKVYFPSDGDGGSVTTSAAGATSTPGTTTYTATTATDSGYNPATAPTDPLQPGCLITTSGGFYAPVKKFAAGAGGIITVDKWLHRNPFLIGTVPAAGTAFTVYTTPRVAGTNPQCCVARALRTRLETLFFREMIAAGNLQLVDAAGNNLLPSNGFVMGINTTQWFGWGVYGATRRGIIGFKATTTNQLAAEATLGILEVEGSRTPIPNQY